MYWRSEKEIIEEFVKVLRRIFTYVETLSNKDKELITLPTGSLPKAIFESFASEEEAYPQIRVDSGGMSFIDHMNNLVTVSSGDEAYLGSRPLKRITVSHDNPLFIYLPSTLINTVVRGFIIPHANEDYLGGEDIDVFLRHTISVHTPIPSLQIITDASGSLFGNPSATYMQSFVQMYPENASILSDTYYLEIIPRVDNIYTFGIDEDAEGTYAYYENGNYSVEQGSLHATIISPAFIRIGGGIEGSILVKCASKDDSATSRNFSSIVAIYCNLLKQAQISRRETGYYADKLSLVFGSNEIYDEWLEKGIRIKSIRQNPINYRRRSSNEIIYESTIIIDVATEWFQDFNANTLEEINVDIYSLLPPDFIKTDIVVTNEIPKENYFVTSDNEYFECPEGILVVL